jgi:MerR family transcriptional regulator, light-induced transcriptional regulator
MARRLEEDPGEVGPRGEAEELSGASIRVVANRTGIAADTLRVWERRYGFPRPARRPGGSRVYSEDEVLRLQLIARAMAAGFRPGEVVTLAPGDLARLVAVSVADASILAATPGPARASGGRPLAVGPAPTLEDLIGALEGDDLVGLRGLLRVAAAALGPRAFVTDLAHPLAVRVGDLWAKGRLQLRHEHAASACLTSQLHLLLGALDDGTSSPVVLLTTLPGEPHVLGVDMVSVYLAASHAGPRVLGGDTPPAQIVEAARALSVDAVGLSISAAADEREASRAASWLADALPRELELWLGGAGARAVAHAVPSATVVSTWPELDVALSGLRARLRARASS